MKEVKIMNAMKMKRWVEVKGNIVEFGNIVGGFVGAPYSYTCHTNEDAFAFGKFLEHTDPDDGLPVAVTDAVLVRFSAQSTPQSTSVV